MLSTKLNNRTIRSAYWERNVFYCLLLAHLVYVWLLPIFLTQDGPSHLYNSKLLLDIISGSNAEFLRQYLDLNLQIFPNWFSTACLSLLLIVFPPIIAEKVFISIMIIALPLSFRFALRHIHPDSLFLSSAAFVIANSYFLMYGFFNFQWSLAFFFLFIGMYYRARSTLSIRQSAWLSLVLIVIFLTHPVALIQIFVFLAIDTTIRLFKNIIDRTNNQKRLLGYLPKLLIIVLPSLALFMYFMLRQESAASLFDNRMTMENVRTLMTGNKLYVFSLHEKKLLALFAIITFSYACLALYKTIRRTIVSHSLIMCLLFVFNLFVYFFVSDSLAGGAYLSLRTISFIYITLLLVSATHSFGHFSKLLHVILICFVSVGLLILRYPFQKEIGNLVKEYVDVKDQIDEGKTLLPLGYSNYGRVNSKFLSPRIRLFNHISGYIGASKDVLSFDNYEANTKYFPLIWKEYYNPYLHISKGRPDGLALSPPWVNITSFNNRKDCSIDYVLLWGDEARYRNSWAVHYIRTSLDKEYELIYTSSDKLSSLYKRIE